MLNTLFAVVIATSIVAVLAIYGGLAAAMLLVSTIASAWWTSYILTHQ